MAAAVPDGFGGAIVAWRDGRDGEHWVIYTQHIRSDLSLDATWPPNGLAPAPWTRGQSDVAMIEDGAGGAILAWQDGGLSTEIFSTVKAQHVLANGTLDPRWPVGGLSLATPSGDQIQPSLVSDGRGGAIAGWLDRRSRLAFELYSQHVRSDGTTDPAWPANGRAIPGSPPQTSLDAVSDNAGGALFFWSEHVPNGQSRFMAHHVQADGAIDPRWPPLGRALSSDPGTQQYALDVVSDGAHGAIGAWAQVTNFRQHVVVQHILGDGGVDPAWSDTGRVVSTFSNNQYKPILCGDESGGVFVAWEENTSPVTLHLGHLFATGTLDPDWPAGGLLLASPDGTGAVTDLLPDGRGGTLATCLVTGTDATQSAFVQHVKASGRFDPAWPIGGQEIIPPTAIVFLPAVVSDGRGGEVAAWSARGTPAQGTDVFASALHSNGRPVRATGMEEAAEESTDSDQDASSLALTLASGNPASRESETVLHFSVPRAMQARLDVYDAVGRLVSTAFEGSLPVGPGNLTWNGKDSSGRSVGPGLYFYRLSLGGERRVVRGIKF